MLDEIREVYDSVDMLSCFGRNLAAAAFHSDLFPRSLAKWHGATPGVPHDGIQYMQDEDMNIVLRSKNVMRSMETEFVNGKSPSRTCGTENDAIKRTVKCTGERVSNSLSNHLIALEVCLKEEDDPGYWETWYPIYENIYSSLRSTSKGLRLPSHCMGRSHHAAIPRGGADRRRCRGQRRQ